MERFQLKEVLKILLHSIIFQRALGECRLRDVDSELFDISCAASPASAEWRPSLTSARAAPGTCDVTPGWSRRGWRSMPRPSPLRSSEAPACRSPSLSGARARRPSVSSAPRRDPGLLLARRRPLRSASLPAPAQERVVWERWTIPLVVVPTFAQLHRHMGGAQMPPGAHGAGRSTEADSQDEESRRRQASLEAPPLPPPSSVELGAHPALSLGLGRPCCAGGSSSS